MKELAQICGEPDLHIRLDKMGKWVNKYVNTFTVDMPYKDTLESRVDEAYQNKVDAKGLTQVASKAVMNFGTVEPLPERGQSGARLTPEGYRANRYSLTVIRMTEEDKEEKKNVVQTV